MNYRVKIRICLVDGQGEKVSFQINDQTPIEIGGSSPGFTGLDDGSGKVFCRLAIHQGQLQIQGHPGNEVVINGEASRQFILHPGDILDAGTGKIEFLEVPEAQIEEETHTRFVDLNAPAATNAPISRIPTKPELTQTSPTITRNIAAGDESEDGATAMIMRSTVTREVKRPLQKKRPPTTFDPTSGMQAINREMVQHVLISLGMIAISSEVAVAVASSFKFPISPIPAPIPSLVMCTVGALFSYGFSKSKKFFETEVFFNEALRTFAWLMFLWMPGAMAFAFPFSVVSLMVALVGVVWTTAFTLRYAPQRNRFVMVAALLWIVGFSTAKHEVGQVTDKLQAEQELIEANSGLPEPAPSLNPDLVKMAQGQINPGVAAQAAAPVQAPAPAPAPAAQSVATAAPDPLAQEQFFSAIRDGNLNTVKYYIDRRAVDPSFTIDHGSSPIHIAAAAGRLSIVEYFVSKQRVNVNAQDPSGTTPLMWATFHNHRDVVAYLLRHGARTNLKRDDGDTAYSIAQRNNNKYLMAMLSGTASGEPSRALASQPKSRH